VPRAAAADAEIIVGHRGGNFGQEVGFGQLESTNNNPETFVCIGADLERLQ